MLRERTLANTPVFIGSGLCCLADKEILEVYGKAKIGAGGGAGGIAQPISAAGTP